MSGRDSMESLVAPESVRLRGLRRSIFAGLLLLAASEAAMHPLEDANSDWVVGFELASFFLAAVVSVLIVTFVRRTGRYTLPVLLGAASGVILVSFEVLLRMASYAGRLGSMTHGAGPLDAAMHLIELTEMGFIVAGLMYIAGETQRALSDSERKATEVTGELLRVNDADAALRALLESTASASGEQYFQTLVRRLAEVLGVRYAFIADCTSDVSEGIVHCRAFWNNMGYGENESWACEGSPCADAAPSVPVFISDNVVDRYPGDSFLTGFGARSYLGACILSRTGAVIGHIAVVHDEPLEPDPRREWILRIFGERAGMEMERLHYEDRLIEQAAIIDSATDPVFTGTAEGIVLTWNAGATALFGYTAEEVVGRSIRDIFPEDTAEDHARFMRHAQRGEGTTLWDVPRRCKDGRIVRVSSNVFPVRDASGKVKYFASVVRDMTQELQREEALQTVRQQFEFMAEHSRDFVWMLDRDLRFTYASPSIERITGYPAAHFLGQDVSANTTEADAEAARTLAAAGVRGELEEAIFEFRMRTREGGLAVLEASAVVMRDAAGEVTGFQGVSRDITQRKEAEAALRASEERYRFLAEHARDLIWVMDTNLRYTYVSPSVEHVTGFTVDEWMNGPPFFAIVEEDIPAAQALVEAALQGTLDSATYELRNRTKDGRIVAFESSAVVLRDDEGHVVGFQGLSRDVTERNRAQAALRASEEKFRFMSDRMADVVWSLDQKFLITYVSPSMERVTGFTVEESLGRISTFNTPPDEAERLSPLFQDLVSGKIREAMFQQRSLTKDGREIVYDVSAVSKFDDAGVFMGMQGISREITQRVAAERALRRSESDFRYLAEHMNDLIWRADATGHLTYASPSYERVLGYRPEEVHGKYAPFNAAPGEVPRVEGVIREAFAGGAQEVTLEYVAIHRDGRPVDIEVSMVLLRDEAGVITGLQGISRDITARRAMERTLRDREAQYRRIVETAHEGIAVSDSERRIQFANERMAAPLGRPLDAVIGHLIDEFIFEEDALLGTERMKELLIANTLTFEFRYRLPGGGVVWAEVSASVMRDEAGMPTGILSMCADITQRKAEEHRRRELEIQVQHAQKLESLGVLAGGIAHDFNNLLAGILGHASLLGQELQPSDPKQEYIENIVLASNRAAELTRQMLAYSGRGRVTTERVDLTKLTREMAGLVRTSISKNASLQFHLDDALPTIKGDSGQLSQVVMNLIINASDAIGESRGRIDVTTRCVDVTEDVLARSIVRAEGAAPGCYVMFEIVDSGCGMDAETKARIFEPFFTTKFTGRGLGLSAVLGIVRGHGGALAVDSEPGQGTMMRVFLPAGPRMDGESHPAPDELHDNTNRIELRGHALVVDDDSSVLSMATKTLVRSGMTVETATNGQEAVEAFSKDPQGFSVVILDLTMPVMNGREAFAAIRAIRGDVPVIISSGFSENDLAQQIGSHSHLMMMQKPYRLDDFVDNVGKMLNGVGVSRGN